MPRNYMYVGNNKSNIVRISNIVGKLHIYASSYTEYMKYVQKVYTSCLECLLKYDSNRLLINVPFSYAVNGCVLLVYQIYMLVMFEDLKKVTKFKINLKNNYQLRVVTAPIYSTICLVPPTNGLKIEIIFIFYLGRVNANMWS